MPNPDRPLLRPLLDLGVALALLTRLPLPRLPDHCFEHQARAVWAFPLAGVAVSLPACGAALGALSLGLSPMLAAGLLIAVQVAITGAMHEDGLADTADGLWGGFTRERRLEIMSDSRIGTYGVLALILAVGLSWSALIPLLSTGNWPAVIAAAALSRAPLPLMMTVLPPARPGGLSRGVGRPGWFTSLCALVLGSCIAWIAVGSVILLPAAVAMVSLAGLAALARAKIGGQTGDILGAAQQIAMLCLLAGLGITASG